MVKLSKSAVIHKFGITLTGAKFECGSILGGALAPQKYSPTGAIFMPVLYERAGARTKSH
jgi:hypothetical protein